MNKIKIFLMIAVLTLFGGIYAACDSGSSTAGDYWESDYNVVAGMVGIPAGGTVSVTHGLPATPTSVVVSYSLVQSGSVVSVVAPATYFTDTTFLVYCYTFAGSGSPSEASSGSASYVATVE